MIKNLHLQKRLNLQNFQEESIFTYPLSRWCENIFERNELCVSILKVKLHVLKWTQLDSKNFSYKVIVAYIDNFSWSERLLCRMKQLASNYYNFVLKREVCIFTYWVPFS